ncbi:putative flavoprotein [Astrocystis sublimbata]|nr:putative flavoprotein [Astrocystis sublimbata]
MLSSVSNGYDPHSSQRNSVRALTESLDDGKIHLLLACSGSVATIKLPNIIQALSIYPSTQLSIRVILTPSASRFLAGQSKEQPTISGISHLPNVDAYTDADEWKVPWVRGAGILHIELRRWADVLVIAPLSANTLAKIVGGFSDSLLTSVVRAWDPWGELDVNANANNRRTRKRRIIVAPAMNTAMWRHPITAKQLRVLEDEWGVHSTTTSTSISTSTQDSSNLVAPLTPPGNTEKGMSSVAEGKGHDDGWFEVLRPQSKVLACGDAGDGAMLEWTEIVGVIEERLGLGLGR